MALETAYFGAGCFWHSELVFSKVDGVKETEVGYCKPKIANRNKSSKVEVVKVMYDDAITDYKTLIETFWETHNPSNPSNKNITNVERSVLFFINENQKNVAQLALKKKSSDQTIYTSIHEVDGYQRAPQKDQKYYFKQK